MFQLGEKPEKEKFKMGENQKYKNNFLTSRPNFSSGMGSDENVLTGETKSGQDSMTGLGKSRKTLDNCFAVTNAIYTVETRTNLEIYGGGANLDEMIER